MKKILTTLWCLFILLPIISWVCPVAEANASDQSQISVVVFMGKKVLNDSKAVAEIRNTLINKFKDAKSIAVYGDDQPKSPEFLEFMEKIKTDPVNESGIRAITTEALEQYGKDMKSNYVVLITILPFNSWQYGNGDMKAQISVFDVSAGRYVEAINWYKEDSNWVSASKFLIKKISTDFNWVPPAGEPSNKNDIAQIEEKKLSVVVFLADTILERPELAEQIRNTIAQKFRVTNVPIFIDDRPKSSEFLNFIGGVLTDSAKQQTFILKKERLVEYGKQTGSNPLIMIMISTVGKDGYYGYHLKEDILIIDTETNKYLANVIYDTGKAKSRQEGIDYLMNKLQNEFKLQ
jgi:hypothetical protein